MTPEHSLIDLAENPLDRLEIVLINISWFRWTGELWQVWRSSWRLNQRVGRTLAPAIRWVSHESNVTQDNIDHTEKVARTGQINLILNVGSFCPPLVLNQETPHSGNSSCIACPRQATGSRGKNRVWAMKNSQKTRPWLACRNSKPPTTAKLAQKKTRTQAIFQPANLFSSFQLQLDSETFFCSNNF